MTSRHTFDAIYDGRTALGERVPWDIGAPQPVIVDLVEAGRIRGDVLDAGCGTGEHALLLAACGYRATAFDISPVAIARARAKARARGLVVTFDVANAADLHPYHDAFDSVIDCGLFDSCSGRIRQSYARHLHHACREGATVYLLELSGQAAGIMRERFTDVGVPAAITGRIPALDADDIEVAFADGWRVEAIEESTMLAYLPGTGELADLPALFAVIRRG